MGISCGSEAFKRRVAYSITVIILATIYYILKCLFFSYWSIRNTHVKHECACILSDVSLLDTVRTYVCTYVTRYIQNCAF